MDEPALILGVDYGSRDWTALTMFERARDGSGTLNLIAHEVCDVIGDLNRQMVRMIRDHSRPRGYSQSHWRKIWKQRTAMEIVDDARD